MAQCIESSSRPQREQLLTNPVVEFLENHPDQACLTEVDKLGHAADLQYNTRSDIWVHQEDLPTASLYQVSEERKRTLQVALANFSRAVEKYQTKYPNRKSILNAKPLQQYAMEDVLAAIKSIEVSQEVKEYPQGLAALGKGFERTMKSKGMLRQLLDFVPRDSYCAPICGSFSFILAALDRVGDFRKEVVATLSHIPTQLEGIKSLAKVYRKSEELQICVDHVFAAMFGLLESLVKQMTEKISKKIVSSLFQSYASQQKSAMVSFSESITRFREQASIDSHKKIGDIDESVQKVLQRVNSNGLVLRSMTSAGQEALKELEDLKSRFAEAKKERAQEREEFLMYFNRMYQLLASTQSLDRSAGTFKNNMLTAPRKPRPFRAATPSPAPAASRGKTTLRLIKDWLAEAGIGKSTAQKDRRLTLSRFYDLDIESKDILWWILGTPELKAWLNTEGPQSLLVQSETPPDDLLNPLSFAAAFLADRIQSIDADNIPVLSFMTGVRRVESVHSKSELRPLSIMNHLNTQLLAFILKQRIQIDLSAILKPEKTLTRTQSNLSAALRLTEQILTQFPEDSMLFIIIDSAAAHDGADDDNRSELRLFTGLLQLGDRTGVAVKVLLMDTLPGLAASLRKVPFECLLVPDSVDGERQDLAFDTLAADADEAAFVPFLQTLHASQDDESSDESELREEARWSSSDSDS
ncbi:uncharacterized protein A1O9_11558 [Exophiala aquamarina CBS 119918]|uniref:Uncharacterized protein n=1 Tax=Exophiala aquamarina CBS 119918 TaxID=1182545 RepID=A0A072NZ90_9EURO|nr:uncharacterized protein A1O9_11558 [Exophiala aquamarina CBS 119918]KEF52318.1 hypothetical protein A1O9_11558 [Exophiala aquamarina CBS 119918]